MIIKSLTKIAYKGTDDRKAYPVLPVKVGLTFPGHRRRYNISRPSSIELIRDALKNASNIVVSFSPTPRELADGAAIPLSEISVTARGISAKESKGSALDLEIEAIDRVALISITQRTPYLKCGVQEIESASKFAGQKRDELVSEIISLCQKIEGKESGIDPKLTEMAQAEHSNDSDFADSVAAFSPFGPFERQSILEAIDIKKRLQLLQDLLQRELDQAQLSLQLSHKAERELKDRRRRDFLEQKLEEIKRELGGKFVEEHASAALKKKINLATKLPSSVREYAWEEASRLSVLSLGSAEYISTKHYVERLLALPWKKGPAESVLNIERLKNAIFKEFYGSKHIKQTVFERVWSNLLTGGGTTPPVICFAGSPGTGKAALARAIAKGLGREFVRLSMGGVVDIYEIKGSNRAMIGSTPGIFIRAMEKLSTPNPVIYVEDLEYLGEGGDSSLGLSLLEVMDSRMNANFVDNYLGIPFDFSEAVFICGVRYLDGVPEPLQYRLEVIDLPGYIEKEKVTIAKRYLIPEILKKFGFSRSEVTINSDGLTKIIRDYTMEAGLLDFSRLLDRIFRHIVSEKQNDKRKVWKIDSALIESTLGTPIFIAEKPVKEPEIGVATGLAWTGAGGELMLIECLKMKGEGNITSTGSLGDVMRESIQAAHSYVRSKADMLGIDHDDFKNYDIHVHFPSGAIPKDGPSAGIAVTLAIASVMSERPVRNDIAMSGEVTLRGKILPIGGVKEKVAAAYRSGIPIVSLPKENEKDLKELPSEIKRNTKFVFIDSAEEIFEQALLDFTPSAHTLEKMFVEELEKARSKRNTRSKTRKRAAKSVKKVSRPRKVGKSDS